MAEELLFPIELNLCETSVRFTGHLVGDRLTANIYDTSCKTVRPFGTLRIRRDQWPALKKHGDTLLGELRYLMSVDGKKTFMGMQEAGITFDSGWAKVEIVGLVLEPDLSVRNITTEEVARLTEIADAHSESK